MKILQIEDNPGDARLIQEILRDQPGEFTITNVGSVGDGLHYMKSNEIDVIMLDLYLPDSSGLETLTKVKISFPQFPIIVMTSLDDEDLGLQAMRRGAEDYLVKGQIDGRLLHRVLLYSIERKKQEDELNQLNRTLKALSDSNQALMRAADESEYLQEICNIIIKDCGHTMVWIGYKENDEKKSVRVVASAGFDEGYLDTIDVTWADSERGRGPTGTAIRTGKPSMCRNMVTDPNFAPWSEEALRRGYASSIVLPLISDGKTFGALTLYSREPDPFTQNEVQLLAEMADDLSYGITALRLREAHFRAEEEIQRSEKRYRELFNSMTEGFGVHEMILDDRGQPCDYRYIEINPAFERLTGLKHDEVVGKTHNEVFPGNDPIFLLSYGKVVLTGEPVHFENYSPPLQKYFEVFAYRTAPLQFATVFIDITDRIKAQAELIQREREYRLLMEEASDGIVLIGKDGYLISANPRACRLLGHTEDEIIGKKVWTFLDPAELGAIQGGVRKLESGESVVIEHRLVKDDDSTLYVETNTRKLADGRYQTIIRDISERKKAEAEFTHAIKTQVFERLFTTLHEFRHGEGLAMNLHRISLFAKNIELFVDDGSPEPCTESDGGRAPNARISPRARLEVAVDEYKTVGYQSLLTIASLIRTIEVELNQKISGVEEPVSGRDLESLTGVLKSETEEFLQLMQSKVPDVPAADYSPLANKIAGHIDTLLGEIQTVTRQLSEYFTSDAADVVESIVKTYRISVADVQIDIENYAGDTKAIISPNELGEVISLLIANSIEALSGFGSVKTGRKPRITLRLIGTAKGVKIEVEDTGGGIPSDVADVIFTKGYSTKGAERGHGLGFVQGHLSKYGGTISYDKAFHEGARFVVELVSP